MNDERWATFWLAVAVACMVALWLLLAWIKPALAHDPAHHEFDDWYATLMRPDAPQNSCCGKADAYWCDTISVRGGKTYCTITDDRDDGPLGRPHIPVGTEFEIPDQKLKWDRGNPTGHAVIFVNVYGFVWCFVQGTGT